MAKAFVGSNPTPRTNVLVHINSPETVVFLLSWISVTREELRDRSTYVYLPSEEMAEEWKDRARKTGVSISEFVFEHVANSLRQEEGEAQASES